MSRSAFRLLAAIAFATPALLAQGKPVEGKDYLVVERKRFVDQTGFDRPIEAFSLLFPRGWKVEGGVKWLPMGGCRADLSSNYVTASSPDGAIEYTVMPSRSFLWSDDPMMLQSMQAGAQGGGCRVNQPFDAARYIEGFARLDLRATASDIQPDESRMPTFRQMDAQANATARQYGNNLQQNTTMAYGKITWPDGREGLLHVGVNSTVNRRADAFSGRTTSDFTTSVFYCVLVRYPAARRQEALRLSSMVTASFRQNPAWQQAKQQLLTNVGNIEHQGRMETIRRMGEQSRAYARAQSEAADQRLRDWEGRQNAQDRQHRSFIRTIREVDAWSDASGVVELSSGYNQAWSRGDGRYILSNTPTFDPRTVLQDQQWREMKRVDP
ncbi:MAG: hypothetical protein SFV54_13520 [Bryobacteraceae bacterium]|nr:hypothetical protein [Bryobacteraceae bacterium]